MDRTLRRDALIALALGLALSLVWAVRDRANLSALRLPDTDDVMRLQQVRDWLGGQAFGDLAQHRLGSGLQMHWSRLADLAPAALIATLTPTVGAHQAEIAAVIACPAALFVVALFLVARIARAIGSDPATATVIAAIAYPATTIFLPGRIDHHALQVVLLLAALLAALGPDKLGQGIAVGGAIAASLVVGLETAPLLGMIGAAIVVDWVAGRGERRLLGLGIGALAGLAAVRAVFAGSGWGYPACDGFTAIAWRAALPVATAPLLIAAVGPRATTVRQRLAVTLAIGGGAIGVALLRSPQCLSPYGDLDPRLVSLWLSKVGEAQSVAVAPPATTIGYVGLMIAGIAAAAWWLRRAPSRDRAVLIALQASALAIGLVQLRGAYAGALLAAPALAALVGAARAKGTPPLVGAWLVSAGLLYPLAAEALRPPASIGAGPAGDCASPAAVAALATLPPGVVMAPIDTGAWGIAATRHRFVAGPYHRNQAGNLAMFGLYRGQDRSMIARWRVDYVMACFGWTPPPLSGWRIAARSDEGTAIFSRR